MAGKGKPGRPKGKTNADYEAERALAETPAGEMVKQQSTQERIASRQRKDLVHLQRTIDVAVRTGDLEPSDIGQLSRSTKILHELERTAHGFNKQSAQVSAILIFPQAPQTMEEWAALSQGVFGTKHLPPPAPTRQIEADIIHDGEPDDDD